jgi:hypothetical protein
MGKGTLRNFLDGHPIQDLVRSKAVSREKTVTTVPSGFDHSFPRATIQFIMMMS